MNIKLSLLLFLSLILFSGCTKPVQKTNANIKLNLSKIVNFSGGIGSGGAILFGKKGNGDMFGKKLSGVEENLDIPNGAWTFYALMWDTSGSAPVMNGVVHCGKTSVLLNGTAATIALNLNNVNCADPEFSGGKTYVSSSINRFADVFIEECDEINGLTGFSCGLENQGSALSYRFVFNNFKKSAAGIIFDNNALVSDCKMIDTASASPNVYFSGLPVNFPSGDGVSPFIGSIEFFMGNTNCTPDAKGVHRLTLNQGAGNATSPEHRVLVSNNTCTPSSPDFSTGTNEQKKNKCDLFFGSWDGSNCNGAFLPVVTRFAHSGVCGSQAGANVAIKHQFKLPKIALCGPYINSSAQIGAHQFSGGDGSTIRPYKICTEWQLNQIGDANNAPGEFMSSNFKLMNDLDMNKTDFGPYSKPTCAGVPTSLYEGHHNLNPLNRVINGACNSVATVVGYNALFDGNNKTIKNARISAKTVPYLGFTRNLGSSGKVQNLNFENLEVEGDSYVGGVSGQMTSGSQVFNVEVEGGEIRAENGYAGAVSGQVSGTAKIDMVHVRDVDMRANNYLGGLVGFNQGAISRSMFRGDIDFYNNISAAVGGIAGTQTATGSITTSFSEGSLISSAQYNGGIVGSNTNGTINHAYSTMFISSRWMGASSAIGGIVGANSGSNIRYLYSDSILEYTGGGSTPSQDGIVGTGTAPAFLTDCMSTASVTASGCTSRTYSTMRDGSNLAQVEWTNINGTLPRLAWESDLGTRPCLLSLNLASVSVQVVANRGDSESNPIIICSSSQLKVLNVASSGKFYRLAEDLNISDWFNTDMLTVFFGQLNGDYNSLYGLNIISLANYPHGIFRNNAGTIKNLNLMGNKIINTGADVSAILAGNNTGSISDITMFGNNLDGVDYVGSIAGVNTGTINQVQVSTGLIRGQSYVGGVAGSNNSGTILRSTSEVDLRDLAAYPAYYKFGGVSGANSGTIDQTIFEGRMGFINQVSGGVNANVYIGGLVGYNNGLVKNSVTENYSVVKTKNYNYVGGLIGYNDTSGIIQTSMSLGSVIYDFGGTAIPTGKLFNQLIGSDNGSVDADTYFIEKHAGALLQNVQANSCNGTIVDFTTAAPAILNSGSTTSDMFINQNLGGGNQNLTNFFSYAAPATNFLVTSNATCSPSDYFNIFKSFEESSTGLLTIAGFADKNNFSNYDMAYIDPLNSANSLREDDLFEYYRATMDNRTPTRAVPIWEYEEGESRPRLVQVRN